MKLLVAASLLLVIGCGAKKQPPPQSTASDEAGYHTDARYKYEHRTGSSGSYNYNYDVSGTDENGDEVSGNVDMQGKYGTGTITDAEGNEKELDLEWVNKGQIEGTDEEGKTYDLEVDD